MPSKTGSIALRLDDVQPPKTAATQSLEMSFSAFSAKTVGSDAPSSATTSSCLPSTPPAALISSAARSSESRTVCSEIAIVPDSELRNPTLTVSPEVSTHEGSPPDARRGAAGVVDARAAAAGEAQRDGECRGGERE